MSQQLLTINWHREPSLERLITLDRVLKKVNVPIEAIESYKDYEFVITKYYAIVFHPGEVWSGLLPEDSSRIFTIALIQVFITSLWIELDRQRQNQSKNN